jgi:hypothetical protein
MKQFYTYLSAFLLGIFGLITLFLSSSVIFDLFGVRASEGNYVLFVVWANFLSSLIYLIAAYGFIKTKKWTSLLLSISGIVLIFAFIGLLMHINAGGIHETKTIGALIFRITVTTLFAVVAHFILKRTIK